MPHGYYPRPPPPTIDSPRLPCPPFDLPDPSWLPIEVLEPSGSDEVTKNLIKQCQVGCWAELDNLRFSCKVIGDDKVKKWYVNCMEECFKSKGKHIDFALWQALPTK
ncbi:unnamed protein product [Cylicocyclus nassatus]|uniref:Uncharacterized protein n=1 Tax=Cylicocyclus nassatus TaxID=53992 RepID=A0AA36MAM0_CYLNA|nr:unnamed protein product [Cylicocyclus nassatus]